MPKLALLLALAIAIAGCARAGQPAGVPPAPPTPAVVPTATPAPTELPRPSPSPTALPTELPTMLLQPTMPPPTVPPSTTLPTEQLPTVPPTATPAITPPATPCAAPEQIAQAARTLPSATAPISRTAPAPIATFGYQVVNSYPHDPSAYTQGLQYLDGQLYEGTGLNGQSELRLADLASGAVLRRCALPAHAFGEGIAVLNGMIYQLTWQNHTGLVYDQASFELLSTFSYPGEGWGLTTDGQRLIMSDGTATLRWLDPATLQEVGRIEVYDERGPVLNLNELEFVEGQIFANIWQTDTVARIDPQSGQVVGWIDLSGLLSPAERAQTDVLNGIAYDAAGRRLFVTGKNWPWLFEIALVPK